MTEFRGSTINGKAAANWPAIQQKCAKWDRYIVEVRQLDEQREISRKQMAWLHCDNGPFAMLSDHVGCSRLTAELLLKKKCGESLFIKEIDGERCIISKANLSVKQTNQWFESIFDWMESIGCPVPPPDPAWRINQKELKNEF